MVCIQILIYVKDRLEFIFYKYEKVKFHISKKIRLSLFISSNYFHSRFVFWNNLCVGIYEICFWFRFNFYNIFSYYYEFWFIYIGVFRLAKKGRLLLFSSIGHTSNFFNFLGIIHTILTYTNLRNYLAGKIIVEKMGLEPTTSWLPVKRSSQLSYIP